MLFFLDKLLREADSPPLYDALELNHSKQDTDHSHKTWLIQISNQTSARKQHLRDYPFSNKGKLKMVNSYFPVSLAVEMLDFCAI